MMEFLKMFRAPIFGSALALLVAELSGIAWQGLLLLLVVIGMWRATVCGGR